MGFFLLLGSKFMIPVLSKILVDEMPIVITQQASLRVLGRVRLIARQEEVEDKIITRQASLSLTLKTVSK